MENENMSCCEEHKKLWSLQEDINSRLYLDELIGHGYEQKVNAALWPEKNKEPTK